MNMSYHPRYCRPYTFAQAVGPRPWLGVTFGLMLFVLILSLVMVAGCSKAAGPSRGVVANTEVDQDADAGGLSANTDTSTKKDRDMSAPPDGSLLTDAHETSPSQDAYADSGGGEDALSTVCLNTSLPLPGQPCHEVGVLRCTNVGASVRSFLCYRPNHLRCEKGDSGALQWTLVDCASRNLDPAYNLNDCGFSWSCVIHSSGHVCQPLVIRPVTAQADAVDPEKQRDKVTKSHLQMTGLCLPSNPNPNSRPGTSFVSCGDSLITCTTLTNTGPLAAGIKAAYGKCGQYLERGTWLLPIDICRITDFTCPPKPQLNCVDPYDEGKFVPACFPDFPAGCFVDPVTNKPRCRESCKDAGAPFYP